MKYGHGTPQSKQKIGRNPLQPSVTMEQIFAFDPKRPETATPSPLLNAILSAMCTVCPLSSVMLGKYLDADPKHITGAVKLITGMPYTEMREKWGKNRVEQMKKMHPDWTLDQCCRAAGYADHSALWRTDHRQKRKQEYRELQAYLHTSKEEKRLRLESYLANHPELKQRMDQRENGGENV